VDPVVLAASVAGMLGAMIALNDRGADAHFARGLYSRSTSDCTSSTNLLDPVMVVFYNNGQAPAIRTHVEHHLGWTNQEGRGQWYKIHEDPTVCGKNIEASQRASACGTCDRYHIRFKETYHSDATWGATSLATPHHEEWVRFNGCGITGGHAVFEPYGFQDGRTVVYNQFVPRGGHVHGGTAVWGNTAQMQQCDGAWVGSLDGYVEFIRIPG
jgi:hypothetical protein